MTMDHTILLMMWILIFICLIIFIPKDKILHALVAFHIKQLLTWLLGLIVVELRLIKYPVRLFEFASKTSFTFEFFVFPAICAIFQVHFPTNKSKVIQFGYYTLYATMMTVIEVIIKENSNLIDYINWAWYWTWITLFITLFLSRLYYQWFFRTADTLFGNKKSTIKE